MGVDLLERADRRRQRVEHQRVDRSLHAVYLDRLDGRRRVLVPAFRRNGRVAREHRRDRSIVGVAPRGPVVRMEAALPEVTAAHVSPQQVRALAKVRHVLREMPARFGDESAQVQHHLEADRVLLVHLRHTRALAKQRVQVLTVSLEAGEPRVVIDPGTAPRELLVRDLEVAREPARRALHAVTQADHGKVARARRREGEDRHGIAVVHDHGFRRMSLHAGHDLEPRGSGAQGLEDAARPDRVADALVDAVTQRDLVLGTHVPQARHIDRADHVVAARQHLQAVGRGPTRSSVCPTAGSAVPRCGGPAPGAADRRRRGRTRRRRARRWRECPSSTGARTPRCPLRRW